MVEITTDNTFNIFKSKKFGYLGGSDFAVSDDGLTWYIIQHYTDLSLTNPSTALIGDYYYIADDTGIRKTKDFNTFFDVNAKISDDKHTNLNSFEWFQDLNGSWFIKYNASTDTGTFTYYADFDETTDSFVNAFNQFILPTGGASGLQYVRGKYYIWQSGDRLYRADNFTDKFVQVKTDIVGNVNHNQFSSAVSDNYLYVYFTVDDKTYVRSSKVTNLIHWSEPVEVGNVELGSYFYNPSAISVYPDHDKVTTFDKVLKVTANGFKQTVPISCMVLASLQVQWEQNSTYQISFTAFDDGSVSYTMLSEEAQVEFNGQTYVIKQAVEDASGGVDTKTITASHIYNEINRVRQRKTKTGTLTYSVQDVLSFYLDDKVANSFGFTWSVFGNFDKQQIENLGNSSGSDMLAKIIEQWPQAIIYPDNKLIRVYSPESFAKDYGGRIDYLHNSSDVKMTVDSTTITNQVRVFGKQIENTSDNADDNAPVKYYFEPFIVSEQASINQYGLHPMDDISDERFTDKSKMTVFAKGQLSPNPAVSIEATMEDNEVPYAGEKRHLIAKPLNLETDLIVIGYTWYPFDNAQKNSLSFANLPASILQTQANTNNRIRMVQLMAQQAINAAKTGTRNFVSPTDPMKNDNNDIRTGDIWTLPLLDKKTKSLVRSVNFESEDDSDTNETIYTDPEKMDKINVQFSIWNGSQWLELSNQRTTNKLNDNINSVASQVQEAQAGVDTAVQNAQGAVDRADKAITDAGFATDTATTAKQVADSAKDDAADAKSDSATALDNAKDAIAKAESTASEFGKVSQKADSAVASALDAQSDASLAVEQASSAAADSKDAKQIAGAVRQSYKTLTDGSTMTIAELQNGLAAKLTKKDLDGYATETWAQNQISTTANGINAKLSSVKSTVDGQTTSINDLKADSSSFKSQFTTVNDTLGKQTKDIGSLQASSKELTSGFNTLTTDSKTNKNDISQLKQTADGMQTDISKKIEQKDLNGYATETWTQGQIKLTSDSISETLSKKIEQKDLNGYATQDWTQNQIKITSDGINGTISSVKDKVGDHTTSINDLQADSRGFKSHFTTVDDTLDKQNTNISTLQATSKELSSNFNSLDSDNATNKHDISQLKQNADEINSTVTSVSNKVDNLQIGGRNLLTGTDKDISITSHTTDGWPAWKNIDTGFSFEHGKTYTFSAEAKNSTDKIAEASIRVWEDSTNTQVGIYAFPADGERHSVTITIPTDSHNYHLFLYAGHAGIIPGVDVTTTYHHPKLEKGNKATDWSPAPEDMATVTALSSVDQKADSISTTVTNNKNDSDTKFTNINQTIHGIQSTVKDKADSSAVTQLSNVVDSKVSTKDYNSEITQLASDINLRVQTKDLISQINQQAGGNTLIQVSGGKGKLYLDASSTVFSGKAFIPSAAISSISADKLDVSHVNISNGPNSINMQNGQIMLDNADTDTTLTVDSGITIHGGGGTNYWETYLNNGGLSFAIPTHKGNTGFVGGLYTVERNPGGTWMGGLGLTLNPSDKSDNWFGDYFSIGRDNGDNTSNFDIKYLPKTDGLGRRGLHLLEDLQIYDGSMIHFSHNGTDANKGKDTATIMSYDDGLHIAAENNKKIFLGGNAIGVYGTLTFDGNMGGKTAYLTNLYVQGGKKNSAVPTSKGIVGINAYETAEYYFGDLGENTTDNNGQVVVTIDPLFAETVCLAVPYHVFVSSYSDAYVWVTDRTETSFTVHSSKPNTDFSWEMKAKRKGFDNDRMEQVEGATYDSFDNKHEAQEAGASKQLLKSYDVKDEAQLNEKVTETV